LPIMSQSASVKHPYTFLLSMRETLIPAHIVIAEIAEFRTGEKRVRNFCMEIRELNLTSAEANDHTTPHPGHWCC